MRKAKLVRLQQHYDTFGVFLDDVMDLLGFTASAQQHDIGDYLANGPGLLMIQAQRGQAKSTITAAYAVWYLIHNPSARVLIISAADSLASEISNLIINIMATMPQLECMRPDKSAGDRTAGDGYDIHHTLKGVEKYTTEVHVNVGGTMQMLGGKSEGSFTGGTFSGHQYAKTCTASVEQPISIADCQAPRTDHRQHGTLLG